MGRERACVTCGATDRPLFSHDERPGIYCQPCIDKDDDASGEPEESPKRLRLPRARAGVPAPREMEVQVGAIGGFAQKRERERLEAIKREQAEEAARDRARRAPAKFAAAQAAAERRGAAGRSGA
jgi:hypothetical protein